MKKIAITITAACFCISLAGRSQALDFTSAETEANTDTSLVEALGEIDIAPEQDATSVDPSEEAGWLWAVWVAATAVFSAYAAQAHEPMPTLDTMEDATIDLASEVMFDS